MKQTLFHILLGLATTFLFSSCFVDLDLEPQRPTPSIVVNSIISTDQNAAVHVGKTVFYTERHRPLTPVTDANVLMTINQGVPKLLNLTTIESEETQKNGLYRSDYTAKAGDRIRLDITAANGDHVWAEDIMPQKTLIEKVDTALGAGHNDYSYEMTYRITFTDNPNEKNYYFLHILPAKGSSYEFDFGKDDVFRQNSHGMDLLMEDTQLDGRHGMAFSDELINGKTYTLRVSESLYKSHLEYRADRIIRLYSITESYYRYLLGIFNKSDDSLEEEMIQAGLTEPSPHYTNIKGGVGVFGLMQIDEKNINIGSNKEYYW